VKSVMWGLAFTTWRVTAHGLASRGPECVSNKLRAGESWVSETQRECVSGGEKGEARPQARVRSNKP